MEFINLTPHRIVIRDEEGQEGIIEPSGKIARVEMEYVEEEPTMLGAVEVKITTAKPANIVGLERLEEGNKIYLVSAMVAQAAKACHSLRDLIILSPDTGASAVRNEQGHIIAVRGLVRYI